jgi:hypothetical protein
VLDAMCVVELAMEFMKRKEKTFRCEVWGFSSHGASGGRRNHTLKSMR